MKFLYLIIFVVISVIAYKDNFSFRDTTGTLINITEAPYFDLSVNTVVHDMNRFTSPVQQEFFKMIVDTRGFSDHRQLNDISDRMVLVKVNSTFHTHITLPGPNMCVPKRDGYILTRIFYDDPIFQYALIKRIFPNRYTNETQEFHSKNRLMFRTDVTAEQKITMAGGVYVVHGILYGMITVQPECLENNTQLEHMSLLNIPKVVERLRAVLPRV